MTFNKDLLHHARSIGSSVEEIDKSGFKKECERSAQKQSKNTYNIES